MFMTCRVGLLGFRTQSKSTSHFIRASSDIVKKTTRGPITIYNESVAQNIIKHDAHQHKVMIQLERLHTQILKYEMNPHDSREEIIKNAQSVSSNKGKATSTFQKFLGVYPDDTIQMDNTMFKVSSSGPPKGLYLWGGTGSGKTFMMDMFFENLPVKLKKRIHFHNFMLEVHKSLFVLKSRDKRLHSDDLMSKVVEDMLQGAYVICFDEFQVTDIADAMILKSLFSTLFKNGITLVATSNRPPSELYKNGLQRNLFLPFIDLMEQFTRVHSIIESSTDYRLIKSEHQAKNAYLYPLNQENTDNLNLQFSQCRVRVPSSLMSQAQLQNKGIGELHVQSMQFMVYGHFLNCPDVIVGRKIGKFSFTQLCDNALGVVDYIELAKIFKVVFLTDIPKMNLTSRNQMRRLISLVDAFYEGQVQLILTADAVPTELLEMTAEEKANCPFDEIFAFDRTVSRLLEMRSVEYIARVVSNHGMDFIESIINDVSIVGYDALFREIWSHYSFHCEVIDNKVVDSISVDVARAAMKDILIYANIKQPQIFAKLLANTGSDIDVADIGHAINHILDVDMRPKNNSSRYSSEEFYSIVQPLLSALKTR